MRALHVRILAGAFMLAAVAACTASASVGTTGTTCAQDSTVSCIDGQGWSCTGSDTPEDGNDAILCDDGVSGNAGSLLYCCVTRATTTTTCGPDSTVSTCSAGSFGFSCTNPTEDPSTSYPSFNCSTPVEGASGNALYCCTDETTTTVNEDSGVGTGEDSGPATGEDAGTCALDENVVCTAGSGYSCLGTDMPPGLTCTTYLVSDAGISEYCCQ